MMAKFTSIQKRIQGTKKSASRFGLLAAPVAGALLFASLFGLTSVNAAERAVEIPPPALDQTTPSGTGLQTIVLAGGCFWGIQAVFSHTKGVTEAVSGYAGGKKETAHY